jgi:hypothetical protein
MGDTVAKKIKQAKEVKKRNGRPSDLEKLTSTDYGDIRWLAAKGLTHSEIAGHIGVSDRTLNRWRNKAKGELINKAIKTGQTWHGQPAAKLGLCVLEELDVQYDHWFKLPFTKACKGKILYPIGVSGSDEGLVLTIDKLITITGLSIEDPSILKATKILDEISRLTTCLKLINLVNECLNGTKALERHIDRTPLRWSIYNSFKKKP